VLLAGVCLVAGLVIGAVIGAWAEHNRALTAAYGQHSHITAALPVYDTIAQAKSVRRKPFSSTGFHAARSSSADGQTQPLPLRTEVSAPVYRARHAWFDTKSSHHEGQY